MLPILLGASLALVLSPEPRDGAMSVRAASIRPDSRVLEAAERAAALEERLSRVETAIATLDGMIKEVGKDLARVSLDARKSP